MPKFQVTFDTDMRFGVIEDIWALSEAIAAQKIKDKFYGVEILDIIELD